MGTEQKIRVLFVIAALYDGILGLAFLIFPAVLFSYFDVKPPNHWGYIDFSAALLLVFTVMFANIARAPRVNRNLIPYGILLKVAYCGVVLRYWVAPGVPDVWKPFAVIDAVFAIAFIWAYIALKPPRVETNRRMKRTTD